MQINALGILKLCFFSLIGHEGLFLVAGTSQTLINHVAAVFYKFNFRIATVRTFVACIYNVCEVDEWTGNPAEPPGYQSPLTGVLMCAANMHLKVLK